MTSCQFSSNLCILHIELCVASDGIVLVLQSIFWICHYQSIPYVVDLLFYRYGIKSDMWIMCKITAMLSIRTKDLSSQPVIRIVRNPTMFEIMKLHAALPCMALDLFVHPPTTTRRYDACFFVSKLRKFCRILQLPVCKICKHLVE